jgi:hypothetical protein
MGLNCRTLSVRMSKHKVPEGEDGQNPFAEMLRVMDVEQLIRFRKRLQMVGRKRMVEILTDEIEEREALEKQEHLAKK